MTLRQSKWAHAILLSLSLGVIATLVACSSSSKSKTPPPPTIAISATSGSGQSTEIGTAFSKPLAATVTSGGTPSSGVSVTFTAPSSGASGLFATTTPAATDTETTNSSGVATSQVFTANTTTGSYTVTATATGVTTPASFSLSNATGAAAAIAATSGGGQSANVSTAFTNPLVATVTDSDSNPVSGVSVTFTAPSSGASGLFADNGTPAAIDTETTGANGQATSTVFTANATHGVYSVSANFSGNTGAAATYSLTNNAVVASGVVIQATAGTPQTENVNASTLGGPLVATVTNGGTPVPSVSVTFTAPASGASGTFQSTGTATETDTTDAAGIAVSSAFSPNGTQGTYSVAATTSGASSAANFTITNWDQEAECFTPLPGPTSALQNANPLAPTSTYPAISVLVTDCNGNPLASQSVQFLAEAGTSGSIGIFWQCACNVETNMTNSNGIASTVDLEPNNVSGTFPLTVGPANGGPIITLTVGAAAEAVASLAPGNYVFSMQGEDVTGGGTPYWYAGAFTVGSGGTTVTGGEQDFSDIDGTTGYKVSAEAITGGSIASDAAGNLTVTLNFTDAYINGGAGTVTFAASPVSASKALLIENDGWATSSGELNLQSASLSAPSGGYAFVDSGWTPVIGVADTASPVGIGGVLNVDGAGTISGNGSVFDLNNTAGGTQGNQLLLFAQTFAASAVTGPDSFGLVTFTLNPNNTSLTQIVLDGYMVDNSHIHLIEAADTYNSFTAGVALGQGSNTGAFNDNFIYQYAFVVSLQGYDTNGVDQAAGILAFNPDESVSGVMSTNDLVNATAQSVSANTPGGVFTAESTPVCAGGLATTPCYSMDGPGVGIDGGTGRVTVTNVSDNASFTYNLQLYLDGNGHALVISMDETDSLAGVGAAQAYPYFYFGNGGYWTINNILGSYSMDLTQEVADANCTISECEADAVGLVSGNPGGNNQTITTVNTNGLDQNGALSGGASTLPISATYTAQGSIISPLGIEWITGNGGTLFTDYLIDSTLSVIIENDTSQLTLGVLDIQH
jgi:hypothetical protein